MSQPSSFEVAVLAEKLKRCKSPGTDKISAEMIRNGGNTSRFEIHQLIYCCWNKGELPEKSIIIPVYKDYKTECRNYRHSSLLPTTANNTLSNNFLSRLTKYEDGTMGYRY